YRPATTVPPAREPLEENQIFVPTSRAERPNVTQQPDEARTSKPSQNEPDLAKNRLGNPGYRTPCPPAYRSWVNSSLNSSCILMKHDLPVRRSSFPNMVNNSMYPRSGLRLRYFRYDE